MSLACFSFDVEEWDSPVIFGVDSPHALSTQYSASGCRVLLELLARHDVRTTFFVTGVFARDHPEIVGEMVAKGHEVACHGMAHHDLSKLSYDELKAEVAQGVGAIEDSAGIRVRGFRSPRNIINSNLMRVLQECGMSYDSSCHPAILPNRIWGFLGRGGVHRIGGLVEVPISTLFGLPISWWWMRNVGAWFTRLGAEVSLRVHKYVLLYFHPWEFTALPKVEGLPRHMTAGCGDEALIKLEGLIVSLKGRGCRFTTVSEIASALSSTR